MATKTEKTEAPVPAAPQAEAAEAPPGLTIQDLSTAMQIIGVCQSRGAIKPDEMVIVGSLYSKLHTFLEASGAMASQSPNVTEAPAEASEK